MPVIGFQVNKFLTGKNLYDIAEKFKNTFLIRYDVSISDYFRGGTSSNCSNWEEAEKLLENRDFWESTDLRCDFRRELSRQEGEAVVLLKDLYPVEEDDEVKICVKSASGETYEVGYLDESGRRRELEMHWDPGYEN
jgi:hypothetical protein